MKFKHAWFSAEAKRFSGSVLYRNEMGELIEVTCVSSNSRTTYTRMYEDAKYVGRVTELVNKSRQKVADEIPE